MLRRSRKGLWGRPSWQAASELMMLIKTQVGLSMPPPLFGGQGGTAQLHQVWTQVHEGSLRWGSWQQLGCRWQESPVADILARWTEQTVGLVVLEPEIYFHGKLYQLLQCVGGLG